MMSSSSAALSLDHHHLLPASEQLCYVHCNICDTVLAVSVPFTSLFNTVTVRCGHCSTLLPVNMRGFLLPSANQHHFGHNFFSSPHNHLLNGSPEGISSPTTNFLMNQAAPNDFLLARGGHINEVPRPQINKDINSREIEERIITLSKPSDFDMFACISLHVYPAPEKKQRVPSAYNRFIKEEIQRIKAVNPDISHREAFSAAAKNWAHFPHIQFGLMPDQAMKKPNLCHQDGEGSLMKDGYFASANVGVSPY